MKNKQTNTLPKVGIIFPNHNGGKEPIECLSSINKLNYPKKNLEIIIIDNNSTDGSEIKIKKFYPKVKLIKLKQNIGFAQSINLGINKTQGEYIFIGNDDIVFHPDSLKVMTEYMMRHPEVGITGGKIYYKKMPNKICSSGYMMNFWTGNIQPAPNPDQIKEPDWVQGCALLIPKKVILKIGLLDPQYQLLFDDFDLAMCVKKAGYKVIYLPHAIFWHGESLTVDRNKPHKYYHWYKSKFRFLIKHLPIINIISITLIQIIFIAPYRALILRDGRFTPLIKGLWWNIIHLPPTIKSRYV